MRTRLLTSLFGIPLLLAIIWYASNLLVIFITIIALLGLWEFYTLAQKYGIKINLALRMIGILGIIAFIWNGYMSRYGDSFTLHIIGTTLIITLLFTLINKRDGTFVRSWIINFVGPIYIGYLLSHALMLHYGLPQGYDGRDWLLFAVFTTFATDTGAYLIGRTWGRHQLAPMISPGKTWEGSVGGMVTTIAMSILLASLLDLPLALWKVILLATFLGIIGQLGDLFESVLKRTAKAKHSGTLIAGHGGILDRIDSLLFTIPVTYYSLISIIR